jgi:predicted peroxiredoxin
VKVLYITSSGKADATRASIPYHLAVNGSVEVGHEAGIVVAGDAAGLLAPGVVETVEGVGLPPLRELWAKARDHAVPVYV